MTDATNCTIGEPESSMELSAPGPVATFTPNNYADMWRLAGHLSNSGIVPDALKGKPGAVLSIMASGAHLGLPWSVAIQNAYVIYGRICWPAAILAAIVETSPAFEFFEVLEATDKYATIEAKKHRWKEPRQYTVTIDDAEKAGYLDGKHSEQWVKRPRFMLIAMGRREYARELDPVRCAGLYTPEELETGRAAARVTGPVDEVLTVETLVAKTAPETLDERGVADTDELPEAEQKAFEKELGRKGLMEDAIAALGPGPWREGVRQAILDILKG